MPRYVGLGKETTFGQAAAISKFFDPREFSIVPEKEPILRRSVASRAVLDYYSGKIAVTGDITLPLYPNMGELFLMLLGNVATTQPDPTNAPSVYRHKFTPVEINQAPPSYTLELAEDSVYRRILGAIAESMSLEIPPGEEPAASFSILGVNEEAATALSPSFPAEKPFDENSCSVTLNGVAVTPRSLTLDINNNPSTDHYVIGSKTLPRHIVGDLEVTGAIDLFLDDRTHLDKFLQDGEGSLEIKFTGPIIEATYSYELLFRLPRIVYRTWGADVSGAEPITQSIEFVAIKPATGDVIEIELQNTESGY